MGYEEDIIQKASGLIEELAKDGSIPEDISSIMSNVKQILNNHDEPPYNKIFNAYDELEKLTSNPDWPFHARVLLWKILTVLESIEME